MGYAAEERLQHRLGLIAVVIRSEVPKDAAQLVARHKGAVGADRHTYRSWLDSTSAPIGVQQKLMRHAQVSTTMNVYGNALMAAKREANSKVVRMALRSA